MTKTIDISTFFDGLAKIDERPLYIEFAKEVAGEGDDVILAGKAPVGLYLSVTLHSVAKKLIHRSPVAGDVVIFDLDPF
jgi:hypothetical protein